jgi:hypothetical protein
VRAASFKSLYPKRPTLRECNYALLRRGAPDTALRLLKSDPTDAIP